MIGFQRGNSHDLIVPRSSLKFRDDEGTIIQHCRGSGLSVTLFFENPGSCFSCQNDFEIFIKKLVKFFREIFREFFSRIFSHKNPRHFYVEGRSGTISRKSLKSTNAAEGDDNRNRKTLLRFIVPLRCIGGFERFL